MGWMEMEMIKENVEKSQPMAKAIMCSLLFYTHELRTLPFLAPG